MNRRNQGFSLIELLVAMAIGAIVLLGASSFLASSSESYSRITGSISSERESRALIQQLFSEFPSSIFHEQMVVERDASTWPKGRVGFLCLMPADAQDPDQQIGDLCAVHYYLADLELNGKLTRCVMRGFSDSHLVFDALKSDDLSPLFVPNLDADEPVAMNVLSFEAVPQAIDEATGRWLDMPLPIDSAPAGFKLRLIVARRSITGRLQTTADWDGTSAMAARDLGDPDEPERSTHLEVFESFVPFGRYAAP